MTLTTSLPATLPVLDADPFDPEVLEDPLPFQAALRDAGPVVYLSRYDVYAVGRFDEVRAVLADWQGYGSAAGLGLMNLATETPWRPPSVASEADPPVHDAPRRVLSTILGPRALRGLQPAWAAAAEDLVDGLLAGPAEFDAVTEISETFPLRVLPDAIGLPAEGREKMLPYADLAFNAYGPSNELLQSRMPRMEELTDWVTARCAREVLSPTGFGADIWAAADRGEIAPHHAPEIIRSVLTAGIDTTVNGLSAVLYGLGTHNEHWARLRAQPELARLAFDEAVRWQSPVQAFFRNTTRDTTIAGVDIPQGQKVLVFYSSANHDPRRWGPDAAEFDLDRDPSGHVGFGMGIHQCVGQHVARLEAQAVLQAMARRIKTVDVVGPPRRRINNVLRSTASLPIRIRPA